MSRFLPYSPDQAYQLPPSVKDELGEDPLNMFLHRVVEGLDLREFENAYSDEGGELYAPSLRLKVWLYAYAPGMTSARGLEQRIREDLGCAKSGQAKLSRRDGEAHFLRERVGYALGYTAAILAMCRW